MPIARRYSGGKDVHGACGMLAGKAMNDGERPGNREICNVIGG